MTTVTLNLPDTVVHRATKMAQVLQRSLEEVLTVTLTSNLLDVEDVPAEMQAELLQMTWLSDQELLNIADTYLNETEQAQLISLSERQAQVLTSQEEQGALQTLRERYGQITLRKARALALLSLRAGRPLLGEPATK
ncbi:MAG: hypothetical protein U1F76_14790 [Candidatus Competibacteraceae bacterium]